MSCDILSFIRTLFNKNIQFHMIIATISKLLKGEKVNFEWQEYCSVIVFFVWCFVYCRKVFFFFFNKQGAGFCRRDIIRNQNLGKWARAECLNQWDSLHSPRKKEFNDRLYACLYGIEF